MIERLSGDKRKDRAMTNEQPASRPGYGPFGDRIETYDTLIDYLKSANGTPIVMANAQMRFVDTDGVVSTTPATEATAGLSKYVQELASQVFSMSQAWRADWDTLEALLESIKAHQETIRDLRKELEFSQAIARNNRDRAKEYEEWIATITREDITNIEPERLQFETKHAYGVTPRPYANPITLAKEYGDFRIIEGTRTLQVKSNAEVDRVVVTREDGITVVTSTRDGNPIATLEYPPEVQRIDPEPLQFYHEFTDHDGYKVDVIQAESDI